MRHVAIRELLGHNFKLTLHILELIVMSKKFSDVFKGSFLRNLGGGCHSFSHFLKQGLMKKKENPGVNYNTSFTT